MYAEGKHEDNHCGLAELTTLDWGHLVFATLHLSLSLGASFHGCRTGCALPNILLVRRVFCSVVDLDIIRVSFSWFVSWGAVTVLEVSLVLFPHQLEKPTCYNPVDHQHKQVA